MVISRKKICVILVLLLSASPFFAPKAEAVEPITIALLAPIALKAASIALPYVMRGLQCGAVHSYKLGYDLFDFLRLPVGLLQCTVGIPFGMWQAGVVNVVQGALAPFKLVWDICTWPISFTGVSTGGA